jgi:hypothetical protein
MLGFGHPYITLGVNKITGRAVKKFVLPDKKCAKCYQCPSVPKLS